MSMIHGILSRKGKAIRKEDIHCMVEKTEACCPDGTDIQQTENIFLAAGLLKTLPGNRHEKHPVVIDPETGLQLVADVRIDNREELFEVLGIKKPKGETISDARLILECYKEWGEDCAARLIGDFSFVIWDRRDRKLFCCRDVFALRPFYYYSSDELFVFSSDLDALLALEWIPKELDDRYIADWIGGLHLYENKTPYHGIECLEAAHFLTVREGEVTSKKYWEPDLNREIRFEHEEQYVERYLELFTEAVHCRLASDSPVASFISGGLDSSSIAVVGAGLLKKEGRSLSAFCHVLPKELSNPKEDERGLVELMEKEAGLDISWVCRDSFDKEQQSVSNPFPGTSMSRARAKGCRVFLSGFGGDQIATSHGYYLVRLLLRKGNLKGFFRQAKAQAKQDNRSLLRTILGLLRQHHPFQLFTTSDKNIRKFLFERCVYNKPFAESVSLLDWAPSAHRFGGSPSTSFKELMWRQLTEGKNPHNSSAKFFSNSQLEKRSPMFDRRLVEYCLSLPHEQHRLGQGRRLIRRAMKNILPDAIRLRNDKRFSASPGIQLDISEQLEEKRAVLQQATQYPEVRRCIDLEEIKNRLDELPELIERGKQNEFKLGPTMRALGCADFIVNSVKQLKKEPCNIYEN